MAVSTGRPGATPESPAPPAWTPPRTTAEPGGRSGTHRAVPSCTGIVTRTGAAKTDRAPQGGSVVVGGGLATPTAHLTLAATTRLVIFIFVPTNTVGVARAEFVLARELLLIARAECLGARHADVPKVLRDGGGVRCWVTITLLLPACTEPTGRTGGQTLEVTQIIGGVVNIPEVTGVCLVGDTATGRGCWNDLKQGGSVGVTP